MIQIGINYVSADLSNYISAATLIKLRENKDLFLAFFSEVIGFIKMKTDWPMIPLTEDGGPLLYISAGSNEYGRYVSMTTSGVKVTFNRTREESVFDEDDPSVWYDLVIRALGGNVSETSEPAPNENIQILTTESGYPACVKHGKLVYAVISPELLDSMVSTLAESEEYNPDVSAGMEVLKIFKEVCDE